MPEIVSRVLNNQTVEAKPINDPNFRMLINQPDACNKVERQFGKPPQLVILIKSAAKHETRRQAIRSTWGNESCWGEGKPMIRLFLIGVDPEPTTLSRQQFADEITLYEDILQQDFIDRYNTTVYKVMLGLDWSVRHCPKTSMIILVDDDYFISPRRILRFMERLTPTEQLNLLGGDLLDESHLPVRTDSNESSKKYRVSFEEYPYALYPNYVAGGFTLLSNHVARQLNVATRYTKYFWLDDVFLGLVANKLNLKPTELRYVYSTLGAERPWLFRYYMAVHLPAGVEWVYTYWKQTQSDKFCR